MVFLVKVKTCGSFWNICVLYSWIIYSGYICFISQKNLEQLVGIILTPYSVHGFSFGHYHLCWDPYLTQSNHVPCVCISDLRWCCSFLFAGARKLTLVFYLWVQFGQLLLHLGVWFSLASKWYLPALQKNMQFTLLDTMLLFKYFGDIRLQKCYLCTYLLWLASP